MRTLYVYILASATRVLYIGITNDLYRRVAQHRVGLSGFTRRYRVHHLVYIEPASGPRAAIAREKQLKRWTRARKIALIEGANPEWLDLARDWPSLDVGAQPRTIAPSDSVPGDPINVRQTLVTRVAPRTGGGAGESGCDPSLRSG